MKNLVTYDPFRELRSLQRDVNRLLGGTFERGGSEMISGQWNPSVDISENKDSIVLEAELPGMSPDDVNISIENNVLTIQGERRFEKKQDEDNFHRVERSYGSFTRSFTLPPTVSSENVDAAFENGMLRLTLAKREEAKPRKIEIKATAGQPKTIEAETKSQTANA
jgi:HSP20 family protein